MLNYIDFFFVLWFEPSFAASGISYLFKKSAKHCRKISDFNCIHDLISPLKSKTKF